MFTSSLTQMDLGKGTEKSDVKIWIWVTTYECVSLIMKLWWSYMPVMKYCEGYINIIWYSKNSEGNIIYLLSENINANHTWGKILAIPCICQMCPKCFQPMFNTVIKQCAIFCQFCFQLQQHTLKVSVLYGKSTATQSRIYYSCDEGMQLGVCTETS